MPKFGRRSAVCLTVCLTLFTVSVGFAKAYSYLGYKWSGYPIAIQVEASWPSAWISPLASAMGTWNAASSPFYFNTGSSGHSMYVQDLGYLQPPGKTYINRSGSTLLDTDTVLNTYYQWSTSGEPNKIDVQSVVAHELGHWLVLGDLFGGSDTEKTMYYSILPGETKKRSLETDDINGINYVYP
ncbi:matrixin family metalloprotease [Candidatus Uhrbacteria bacterium]|nr:matrixin family metalloprotease [Candidatus Uhrbacteria bacterium]